MRLPPFNPYIAVLIGVIALSSTPILVKFSLQVPTAVIATYQLLFAVVIMSPFIWFKYRDELKLIYKRDWIFLLFASFFLACHFILWYESLNYTSIASSALLLSLQPILALFGAYLFFQERFSSGALISILIAFFGSFIIVGGDFELSKKAFFGDILALLSAVFIVLYHLYSQRIRKRLTLITYTFVVYVMSTIILILYNIIQQNSLIHVPSHNWWLLIALAIVPTFAGLFLFHWTLKWLHTSTISIAHIFVPISATIFGYLIFNEQITYTLWLGGTITIFGLFLFTVSTTRKKNVTISRKNNHHS